MVTPEQRKEAGRKGYQAYRAKFTAAEWSARQRELGRRRGEQLRFTEEGREHQRRAGQASMRKAATLYGEDYLQQKRQEWRENLRQRTDLEQIVEAALQERDVPYLFNPAVTAVDKRGKKHHYNVDFLLPGGRYIEVDGYHHTLPGAAETDAERDRIIAADQGWTVLRLSTEEIKNPALLAARLDAFLSTEDLAA